MALTAAQTGARPIAMVAVEQRLPAERRIIVDELAGAIAPLGTRAIVSLIGPRGAAWMAAKSDRNFPGVWGGILCRKRFIDEKLLESAGEIDSFVNLGAGFDTRAYRLAPLASVPVWEVDQPRNIDAKRRRLRRLFGEVPEHVTLVPIDFERETLAAELARHGYSSGRRSFFVWEGVTQYLTEAGVRKVLDFLATVARGSRLALTYVRKDFIDGRNLYGDENLHRRYVEQGRLWHFGLDPQDLQGFLEPYRWRVVEHPEPAALARRYIEPTGRALTCMPLERTAYAEKI
ncbi:MULTISPECIES: SAM-dependent methyltransferase [Burkholderia]|uniref:S-adenosyl-L-methionine-dependent methyltransferase n=1 Tax=Burkholderia savannae TaxID=1637837 RepID=A0ABR5T743_9BURK|nr:MULTISPECIES: SAM-dependent methyltransferase [Burkholderia]AOJ72393.1 methyltransferase [Burkholderia savannae]AOK50786.1 methyltransferase [Burkholderia sp. MSMB617WGS]KGR93050.1 methyltransferase, family protein [Burkholderia sp. ABCPW 111]KVG46281.1 methyltransferase [Burkholderia sp. MSMB0265]KVG89572.1 methyltransferase [Burkholderia sp. MSMB2040]